MLNSTWYGGVVSDGTLKPSDLIPKFAAVLAEDFPELAQRHLDHYETLTQQEIADGEEDWILADLVIELEGIAPEGTHFGASEGDGACFGFFSIEEEHQPRLSCKYCACGEVRWTG